MQALKLLFILATSATLSACNAMEPALQNIAAKNIPRVDYIAGTASIEQACQSAAPAQHATALTGTDIQKVDRIEVVTNSENAASFLARGFALLLNGDIAGTNALLNLALKRVDTATSANRVRWSHGWAMLICASTNACSPILRLPIKLTQTTRAGRITPMQ